MSGTPKLPDRPSSRLWRSPPPVWIISLSLLLSGFVVYGESTPAGAGRVMVGRQFSLLGACCVAWPVAWIAIVVDHLARLLGMIESRRLNWRSWRWYVTPLCLVIAAHAALSDWPLEVRFERSRAEFERVALELIAAEPPTTQPENADLAFWVVGPRIRAYSHTVGSFRVGDVAVFPEERVVFFFTGGFLFSGWGVCYNPAGHEIPWAGRSIAPGWYLLEVHHS